MSLHTEPRSPAKDIAGGVAITSIIFAAPFFLPLLGFFSALLIPLPALFYRLKLGRSLGAVVPVGAVFLVASMAGGMSGGVLFFVELLLLGFVIGELLELNLTLERTFLYACGAVLASGLGLMLFYSAVSNVGVMDLLSNYAADNIEMTLVLYKEMEMPEEILSAMRRPETLEKIEYYLVRMIPALVVVFTLFIVWVSLLMVRPLLKAREMNFPDFGALNRWKAPDMLVWWAIGFGALLFVPVDGLTLIGISGVMILMMVYFFQGMAIVSHYFEKKRTPRVFRAVVYTLIAFQYFLLPLIIGMGFFDMWINFRKLETEKIE